MNIRDFTNRTYDLSLVEWISIGLQKTALSQSIDVIAANGHPDELITPNEENQPYISKILREEVKKQFKDPNRPALEVILNAIDARDMSTGEECEIKVKTSFRDLKVEDNGGGMELTDILNQLIIPFLTYKKGEEEFGRFGVGFLSTFNYLVKLPNKSHITIETSKKDSTGYRIEFYSTGIEVGDIRMKIRRRSRKIAGTNVKIRKPFDRNDVNKYLKSHLRNVAPYEALIKINKESINGSSDDFVTIPVEIERGNRTIVQPVAVKVTSVEDERRLATRQYRPKIDKTESKIDLTSKGVTVISHKTESDMYGVVSFPGAIRVVEGRDEFKIDDNYKKCSAAVFEALAQLVEKKNFGRYNAALLSAHMAAAMSIRNLKDIPTIDRLRKTLFPNKEYLLTRSFSRDIDKFFGKEYMSDTAEASLEAIEYWKEFYKGDTDYMMKLRSESEKYSFEDFFDFLSKNDNVHPNLHLLSHKLERKSFDNSGVFGVRLFNFEASTTLPLSIHGGEIYINTGHLLLSGPYNPTKIYAAVSEMYGLRPFRESSFSSGSGENIRLEQMNERYLHDDLKFINHRAKELEVPRVKK